MSAEATRTLWASVQESSARDVWQVTLRAASRVGGATVVSRQVHARGRGWAALGELDVVLRDAGYERSTSWEPGSQAGFVAWVEPILASVVPGPTAPVATVIPTTEERAPESDLELLERYCEYLRARQHSAGTAKLRRGILRRFALAHPGLLEVDAATVEAYVASRSDLSPESVNSLVASIRGFYGWALKRGLVTGDPSHLLERVRLKPRPRRIADEAEVLAIAVAAEPDARAMLLLGLLAGLRVSEIVAVRGDDRVDGWLTVTGKGGKVRRLREATLLTDALDAIQQDADWLFPGRFAGTHLEASTAYRRIKELTGLNPHALRHAAGTAVYNATKDLRLTQEWLGHASPVTTQIYTHITEQRMLDAAAALDSRHDGMNDR